VIKLQWSKMSNEFWDYTVKYANLLYTVTPHKGIQNKISNEMYYYNKVNLKYTKVFIYEAYCKNFSQNKSKFKSSAIKGLLVDFNMKSNYFMIMDTKEYNIHLVREVVFDEKTPSALSYREHNGKLPTNVFNNGSYILELPVITDEVSDVHSMHLNNIY